MILLTTEKYKKNIILEIYQKIENHKQVIIVRIYNENNIYNIYEYEEFILLSVYLNDNILKGIKERAYKSFKERKRIKFAGYQPRVITSKPKPPTSGSNAVN